MVNLVTYEYSTDNINWSTTTEKSGVGSEGINNLIFLSSGSSHHFMWNSGVDLSGISDDTVYVRLKANDTLADGILNGSGAFAVDNVSPVITNVSAIQGVGTKVVTINYDLADANKSCLLYTSPSPRDRQKSRMPSSA